jgi:hypothetical protein
MEFLVAALSACSAGNNAIVDTARSVISREPGAGRGHLDPNFRYLRVTKDGRVALLVLGNQDSHPQGVIEVWYSASREVLRLQNGRLVGAVGLTSEWRNVSVPPLPSWSAIASAGAPVRWVRTRDVMPGYRFGVRDALRLSVSLPPSGTQLQDVDPQHLVWYEEEVETDSGALPPARYAVDLRDGSETVVYGEQCLAPGVCFTWQRWPASP